MKAKIAKKALVSVVMGSDSDLPIMTETTKVLEEFGIDFELILTSAHRTPQRTTKFAASAAGRGIKVIVVGAGAGRPSGRCNRLANNPAGYRHSY